MNRYYAILTLLCVAACVMAGQRTTQQMIDAAAQALADRPYNAAAADGRIVLLDKIQGMSVFGYQSGGFAVIADDDMFPAVLGQSFTTYDKDTKNPNFRWWLAAMQRVVQTPRTEPLKAITPDADRHKEAVPPLMSTSWGQSDPYSKYTPAGCPTGCVATASAQVLRYNEWPDTGVGNPYVYYPFADFDGSCLTDDLAGGNYMYDQMLDSYVRNTGNNMQRKAVATLMYHVGLAMKAEYEGMGTGAYAESLCYGLRRHLKYPLAVVIDRNDYTDEQWMDIIFTQLSQGHPLTYGAADESYYGHEFVLHGYNKQGRVYINWGWDGSEDGYYDLSSLLVYWGMYDFTMYHDMVVRCDTDNLQYQYDEVTLAQAGELGSVLTEWQRDSVVALAITGPINGSDIRLLREMAGMDAYGKGTYGHLSYLDLSQAYIVAGGEPYLIEDDRDYCTSDDVMPYKAFSNCKYLVDVALPNGLTGYEDGVFANCFNLDTVRVQAYDGADFVVDGCYVLSKDSAQLIEALPTDVVYYRVPEGVTFIHDYAFAGRYLYERLALPASLDSVGQYAFNRTFDLRRIYMMGDNPPRIAATAIDPLDVSLRELYVPKGSRTAYRQADGWKSLGSIREFDLNDNIPYRLFDSDDRAMYTIDGMRVTNDNQKRGIVIQNHKKTLLR